MNEAETAVAPAGCLILAFVVFVFTIGPACTIWALNTLFSLEIPLNFQTWCSMAWLHLILVVMVHIKTNG